MIRVGDVVIGPHLFGTVTYVQRSLTGTATSLTVCVGPSALDVRHAKPWEVEVAA